MIRGAVGTQVITVILILEWTALRIFNQEIMTNKELIDNIRDRIKRCIKLCEAAPICSVRAEVNKALLDTLDSLSVEEKPTNLEQELEKWRHEHFGGERDGHYSGEYLERSSQIDLARHFYELRKQAKQEPEGLDEAAKRNAGLNFDREMECDSFWHDVETFKAGVEWAFGQMKK